MVRKFNVLSFPALARKDTEKSQITSVRTVSPEAEIIILYL